MATPDEILQISGSIEQELGFSCPDFAEEAWRVALAARINALILHDFSRLIGILYRLDVSESGLKQHLQAPSPADAGRIIADMVIDRQLQKARSRQNFGVDDQSDEHERW